MSGAKESILIFAGIAAEGKVRRSLGDVAKTASASISEVAVSTLQENMRRFLRSLDTILSVPSEEVRGLTLDQVEVSAQIDGKGNVGLWSVGSAELAAHGGIKLVLRRRG